MKDISNIFLYGISGIYNYGCEAMIRSISSELRTGFSNATIHYLTFNFENDKRNLSDCVDIVLEPVKWKKHCLVQKILRFLRRTLNIPKDEDYLSIDLSWTKKCDLLVIIGGDVFDLTPEQRHSNYYRNDRIFISRIVKKNGGKVVLWGISIGDFDYNPKAKRVLLEYIDKTVDSAIIRDRKSIDYLQKNGIHNASLCSDPAFMQKSIQTSEEKKKVLGINLSPLSNLYLDNTLERSEWINKWTEFICRLCSKMDYQELYLIPHVVNRNNIKDDDYSYLKEIYNKLQNKIPVTLVSENLGFIKIKQFLCKCDLILAARMHCAVNAITCGVPTIFLSYSPKSIGMSIHVYQSEAMALDMNRVVDGLEDDMICEISNRTTEIRKYLSTRNQQLYDDAKQATAIIINSIVDK